MKIVILEPIGLSKEIIDSYIFEMTDLGHDVDYYENRSDSVEENIERAKNADVLMLVNMPIPSNILTECKNLKMISVAFTGVDHIDMNYCRENHILVCNAAGYSNHAVSELAVNMALTLMRNTVWAEQQTRNSKSREGFLGRELFGKTVGIIGAGSIGLQTAKLFSAFGCNVIAYSRTRKESTFIKYVEKEVLLKESDIISLHVPLNQSTENLIDKNAFDIMKPEAILINTARGNVVNANDLIEALKNGKISGAALDVYKKEPPLEKNHKLFDVPNLVLLPHIGYATEEAIKLRGKIIFENIKMWERKNPQNICL
ncbi:MAG: NAD(P)-dependent oxidoreductase [Bacteroidota bacterium]